MSRKKAADNSIFDDFMPSIEGRGSGEDFYSDDEILSSEAEARSRKPFQKFVLPAALVLVTTAFAAGINLTNSDSVEFGQGVLGLKACTPSLELAPVVGFVNEENTFTLEAVDISGIPESCIGYDFLIRVYDEANQAPLTITDLSTDETIQVDYVRFSMLAGRDFAIIGQPNAYLEILDTTSALDSQIAVVYDAGVNSGNIENYADARDAYRVTVETFPTFRG